MPPDRNRQVRSRRSRPSVPDGPDSPLRPLLTPSCRSRMSAILQLSFVKRNNFLATRQVHLAEERSEGLIVSQVCHQGLA